MTDEFIYWFDWKVGKNDNNVGAFGILPTDLSKEFDCLSDELKLKIWSWSSCVWI